MNELTIYFYVVKHIIKIPFYQKNYINCTAKKPHYAASNPKNNNY